MKTSIIGGNVGIYGLSSWNGENPGGMRCAEGTQKITYVRHMQLIFSIKR